MYKCLLLSKFDSYAYVQQQYACKFTKSCQWPKAFAGRVPCNNWTLRLNVNGTPASENSGTFRIRRMSPHDILYKMYLLVSLNITCNIVYVWKAIFRNIYWAEFVQEHRNLRFTGIWDVSAEWGHLFCTVKTICRKDARLSAARWGMPIFPHLSLWYSLIKGVSKMA